MLIGVQLALVKGAMGRPELGSITSTCRLPRGSATFTNMYLPENCTGWVSTVPPLASGIHGAEAIAANVPHAHAVLGEQAITATGEIEIQLFIVGGADDERAADDLLDVGTGPAPVGGIHHLVYAGNDRANSLCLRVTGSTGRWKYQPSKLKPR